MSRNLIVHCGNCGLYYEVPRPIFKRVLDEILDQCACPECKVPRNPFKYNPVIDRCGNCGRPTDKKTKDLCTRCYMAGYRLQKKGDIV